MADEQVKPKKAMDSADLAVLIKHYDKNGDGKLTDDEITAIIADAQKVKAVNPEVAAVLKKYDENKDGKLDAKELGDLVDEIKMATASRYFAYSASFARLFRYLAFTSDVGEALRPVVSARLVNASYGVAFGYCVVDVGYEAYKLQKNNFVHEVTGHKMTMPQLVAERSTFQLAASLVGPAVLIHTCVDGTKHLLARDFFKKMPRVVKWGPSAVGLAIIPLLPVYLDEPAEHGVEWAFKNYGPWAEKPHAK